MTTNEAAAAGLADAIDVPSVVTGGDSPERDGLPTTELVVVERATGEVVDFAEQGVPGHGEFETIAALARVMASSALVPKALQGKPADVFLVLLTGRDLGIPITAATRTIHVIDGTPTLAPKLRVGLVRRKGLGDVKPAPGNTADKAVALVYDAHGKLIGDSTFEWSDAVAAGLVRGDCTGSKHSEVCERLAKSSNWQDRKNACKDNYRKNPKRMLWWRAAGFACDDYFPEVGMGIYSPDELGAVTDEDGNPIDPATVDVPAGFEAAAGMAVDDPLISPEDRTALRDRIAALPDESRAELGRRWEQSDRLQPFAKTLVDLPESRANLFRSMLRGVEAGAKAGGWDPEAALATVVAEREARAAGHQSGQAAPTPAQPAGDAPTPPEPGNGPEIAVQPEQDDSEPGDDPDPDPDAPLPGFDPAVADALAAKVRTWKADAVDSALRESYSLPTKGNIDARRARLVLAMVNAGVDPESLF